MPFRAPVDSLLSVGGFRLTGRGVLMRLAEDPLVHQTAVVRILDEEFQRHVRTGKRSWGMALDGYVRTDVSVHDLIEPPFTTGVSMIYGRFGRDPGAAVDMSTSAIVRDGEIGLPEDDLIRIHGMRLDLADSGGLLIDGTLVARQATPADREAAPYAATRLDLESSHSGPWTVICHIDDLDLDGASRMDIRLWTHAAEEPPANGSGWTQVGSNSSLRFAAGNATRRERTLTGTTALGRWIAWTHTTAGGANPEPTGDIALALHRA